MILPWLIGLPVLGGLAALLLGTRRPRAARLAVLLVLSVDLALALSLWSKAPFGLPAAGGGFFVEFSAPWIPRFGISLHLGIDGLSLLMVLLTLFLGILSVAASWREIEERVGFFHLNLMWVLAGVIGVFLTLDLFLLYFFWELMLVPMYFLIGVHGHERRVFAALKFFIFSQVGGLLMLLSIVALAAAHARATGTLTFDYLALLGTPMGRTTATLLMLGFFVGFAVKLPAFPFHTWLPDAHTEAPTAGSVLLAGLLLKTGAYGLLRFVVPLFPAAAERFAPAAMTLGVIGILYGAMLAFAQNDLKRFVAYTSVSHLGFVLLGVFAWNRLALQGVVMQMICHGLSTGALFMLVGALGERTGTRDLRRLGGLWAAAPRMGALGLVLAMASLGLPGLGNFVAEFLVLAGAFRVQPGLTILAAIGLVFAAIYALVLVQRTFHGGNAEGWKIRDLGRRELVILGSVIVVLVWLGFHPQPVLDAAGPALARLESIVAG